MRYISETVSLDDAFNSLLVKFYLRPITVLYTTAVYHPRAMDCDNAECVAECVADCDNAECVAQRGENEECVLQDAKGMCVWFDSKKGYGFIEMELTDVVVSSLPIPVPNVFAHQSEVLMDGFRFLHPNRAVCCDVYKTSDNRYRATRIRQGDGITREQ